MKTKKHLLLILCLFLAFPCAYAQKQGTYFFSEEEQANIKSSAQTPWGQEIVFQLKAQVDERLKHPLSVPKEEAGHLHDYFCPVHNVFFEFDWNKPDAQYCSHCDKTWSTERINWSWITVAHNKNLQFMNDCLYIYLATGEQKYAKYMKDMLLDYAGKYPNYKVHDKGRNTPEPANYSAKMFAQSLDEAVWFSDVCRMYSIVKPMLKKKEVEKVETGLLWEGANLLLKRGGGGNWQVWNNSGLAAIGVALNNDSIVNIAINHPRVGYRHMMKTHVNRDGWWNEGSANYHFYPLRAMILTAYAVRSMNHNLFDKQLEMMFLAPVKSTYNDLTFPSHNDGWYGVSLPTQIKLYEMAYAYYRNPVMLQTLQACYQIEDRLSPEALLTNTTVDHNKTLKETESYLFGHTGYGVLRSGNKTVMLKYGPSGGGHGHPDKLSISIHNGEKETLTDFGTCAYGIPDYLNWYKRTLSHNTVTVDFKDQRPAMGQITNFDSQSIEAFSDKAYPGVEMTRKLHFKDSKLTDEFYCVSDSVHTYDYLLLLTEKPNISGAFTDATLNESIAYQQIKNVRRSTASRQVIITTSTERITLQVDGVSSFEVFTGNAPGVPPTNPDIVTKTGTERRPVQPCYPVIIRVKDKNLSIKGDWSIR
ncbi:heparinase II/III family protein [Bacteroides sp. 51]|uniref:heparinase II/III domain-containing protein n=1 Tax=Bacteroides sp. 51 TaxID=2302938 RepID=UPI0013D129E8|nr:heparinase II/III family protein [Bacteroides sp. 51]NDV81779.1 heparinase II/III family protein [Bacteroides sp. 51]